MCQHGDMLEQVSICFSGLDTFGLSRTSFDDAKAGHGYALHTARMLHRMASSSMSFADASIIMWVVSEESNPVMIRFLESFIYIGHHTPRVLQMF